MRFFHTPDLRFRAARIWSNNELKKFAQLFSGKIVNVSAHDDSDKEGKFYKDYFTGADEYQKTNYSPDAILPEGEIYLDLEKELPSHLKQKYDVVFNHTTLEHVYNCRNAFKSFCEMSRNAVIVVVPFLQQFHGFKDYNDYWRFTPEAMRNMYEENGISLRYCSANAAFHSAIYIFCIGYRDSSLNDYIPARFDLGFEARHLGGAARLCSALGANVVSNFFDRLLFIKYRKRGY